MTKWVIPGNVRRGLLRLYIVVVLPWVAWFGYRLIDAIEHHWDRQASDALWLLLIVPIGAPILIVAIVWVIGGFRKSLDQDIQSRRQANRQAKTAAKIRDEAKRDIYQRPDILAALFLHDGVLHGRSLKQKFKLDEAMLTLEQKTVLPKTFYGTMGIAPDRLAGSLGYHSGAAMIEHLIRFENGRGDMLLQDYVDQIVQDEVTRRMKKYDDRRARS